MISKTKLLSDELSAYFLDEPPPFLQSKLMDYFEGRVIKSWQGGHILKGKQPGADALMLSSNDYLAINRHPDLIQAQIQALQQYGNGQMQSAVFYSETSNLLQECEQLFAKFLGHQSCVLAQSGWCANTGLLQALASPGLPVYLDFYAHMSFWEGVKSAHAKPIPVRHNSLQSLEQRIQRFGPGIIAVDAIYSTLGTRCPLPQYVEIAKKYNCILIVDESHSLGVYGAKGQGLVAELGLSQDVHFITASLAKAMSGRGGIIAGQAPLIEMIRYNAYPAIFSSTILPHDMAGFNAALNIIRTESWRREKLHHLADQFRELCQSAGINLKGSVSQIFPLFCGSEKNAIQLRDALEAREIYGAVFCYPATPKQEALIRFSLSAQHSPEQLNYIVDSLKDIKKSHPDLPLFLQQR